MEIHNRQKCARCRTIQQMTINRSKQEEFKSYNRIMMEGNVHNEFKSSVLAVNTILLFMVLSIFMIKKMRIVKL